MENPVLHVIVVGFHHKKGCIVEYAYPPLLPGKFGKIDSVKRQNRFFDICHSSHKSMKIFDIFDRESVSKSRDPKKTLKNVVLLLFEHLIYM